MVIEFVLIATTQLCHAAATRDEAFESGKGGCIDEGAMKCPFDVRVVEDYTPSPYEKSHIALKRGQLVTVLEMKSIGKWYGQTYSADGKVEFGKKGLFPFNRVEIVKD